MSLFQYRGTQSRGKKAEKIAEKSSFPIKQTHKNTQEDNLLKWFALKKQNVKIEEMKGWKIS